MKKLIVTMMAIVCCVGAYSQSLDDARKAVEGEQYDKARGILEGLVKTNPADGENFFHLGNLYLILGEDNLASGAFNNGLKAQTNAALNYIGLGQMALNNDKTADAEADFVKATLNMRRKDYREYIFIAQAYTKSIHPDYQKAADYAGKAIAINADAAQAYLLLGDAKYNLGSNNEAYSAYRNAYDLDNTLLRAKLHLAVMTKNARSFNEAVQALTEITTSNPNYGPAYRELAETYYLWSLTASEADGVDYLNKALGYYSQYMAKTDYSLESRMRHADFLIMAKDYSALEKEAMEMQKIDNVNPRILRYLGFSAYENGNYQEAVDALEKFIAVVDPHRVISMDYIYLTKAQAKLAISPEGKVISDQMFNKMIDDISRTIQAEVSPGTDFFNIGTQLYRVGSYDYASKVFGVLIADLKQDALRCLYEKIYYSNSTFYYVANLPEADQKSPAIQDRLAKADAVYGEIIVDAPNTYDAYYNRARLNRYIDGADAKMAGYFQQYIELVTANEAEAAKDNTKGKLSDACTSLGAYYSDIDKPKAIDYLKKALEYSPTNKDAQDRLDYLLQGKRSH